MCGTYLLIPSPNRLSEFIPKSLSRNVNDMTYNLQLRNLDKNYMKKFIKTAGKSTSPLQRIHQCNSPFHISTLLTYVLNHTITQ